MKKLIESGVSVNSQDGVSRLSDCMHGCPQHFWRGGGGGVGRGRVGAVCFKLGDCCQNSHPLSITEGGGGVLHDVIDYDIRHPNSIPYRWKQLFVTHH